MSIMNRHRRGRLRRALRSGVSFFAAGTLLASTAEPVLALPQGGQVAAGDAQIASNAAEMAIHQTSQNAVINWQSFNIAAGERVSVLQPNAQAALLNRVLGSNPSEIFGQLQANGRVFLVNPSGVYFAPGAQVDAGAIIASTMNITNADFMAGRYNFVGTEHDGKVINKASLAAQNGGLIALLGKDVVNEGVVVAKKGTAALAAGEAVTLDFGGDGKVEVVPTKAALEQAVTNKGLVEADGGLVFMSAATGEMLTRSAVNQDGIVHASSLADAPGAIRITARDVNLGTGSLTDASGMQGGTIEIGGGWQGTGTLAHAKNVNIEHGAAVRADATADGGAGGTVAVWSDGETRFAGEITARGRGAGAGGMVETSGHKVRITGLVNASSEAGTGGSWLIDPGNVVIRNLLPGESASSELVDVNSVNTSLSGGSSIIVQTAEGNNDYSLTVQDAIQKTGGSDSTLTLKATGDVNIGADVQNTSTVGKLNVMIVSDTNHLAGGSVNVGAGKHIETLGGNVNIGGGLVMGGVGFANSQSSGVAGITIGSGAVIDTRDSSGTTGGNVEMSGSATGNDTGIALTGAQIHAGAGKVALTGVSSSGKGIIVDSATTVDTRSVDLRTDTIDLQGTITGDGDSDGSATVRTFTEDRTINFGTGSGGLDLAGNTFSSAGKIQGFKKNIVGDAAKKSNIKAGGVTADNNLVLSSAAGKLTVSGAVTVAAGHGLTLASKDSVEGAGVITADAVNLDAADAVVRLTGTHAIQKLDGKAKELAFKNSANLVVGGETGLTIGAGGANIAVTAGDLTVGVHGLKNGAGALALKASGTLSMDAGAEVASTGAADTSLEAGAVAVGTGAKIKTTGGKINVKTDALTLPSGEQGVLSSANGTVTVETKSAGKTMSVNGGTADIQMTDLGFINSGTGAVQIGNASTGSIEIGTTSVDAPLTVTSGATVSVTGAVTNPNNKDVTFKGNTVDFTAGSSLAAGSGTTTIVADSVGLDNGSFTGTGTFRVQKKTAGGFTVGGASTFVSDAGLGKLTGGFYNVEIGAKDYVGTATINTISTGKLPAYTSILTKGALSVTGTVNGGATDTLVLHGEGGLTQTAPIKVGNLLLLGKGTVALDGVANNEIGNIAADMSTGVLKLKNQTDMKVDKIQDRTVTPAADVDGIAAKSTEIHLGIGKKLDVRSNLKTTDDAKLEADKMDLGSKVDIGKQLTLEKADKNSAVNIGTGGDWDGLNNSKYEKIKIGGNGQSGDINIAGTTFKNPSDIETTGKVKLTGTNKAGADGKSDMTITANTAELPTNADSLAVKNLTLNLSGGIDLGNGKVHGAEGGNIKVGNVPTGKDIVISDNASDAAAGDFRISYRTINDTLDGFKGFDVAGDQHVYFYGGAVKKSINAAGKLGVEVRDDLSIEGKGTKLKIGSDPSAGTPDTVINGGFTVKQGKTVHVKGVGAGSEAEGAEINIQTGGDIHLEQGAALKVEGNYAQATLNSRGGDVVLNEDAKVKVVDGSTPVWVDVTGNNV